VLFEHDDGDPGPRQQKAEHDPGRAAAGDAAGDLMRLVCHPQAASLCRSNGNAGMKTHRVRIIRRHLTSTPERSVSCLSRSPPIGCGAR